MSRIPFTVLSRSLRIPLTVGAALAAVVMGGSAWAEESADTTPDSTEEAAPVATPGPTDDLDTIHIFGATTASEKLQWVDPAEAAKPDKADLPEISAADWLPTAQD